MALKVSGPGAVRNTMKSVGTMSFDLSCDDAQDKGDWTLRKWGQPVNPVVPENGKGCICV